MTQVGHIVNENLWYDEKRASLLGRTRRSNPRSRKSDTKLINDHNISDLASRIVYLDAGQTINNVVPEIQHPEAATVKIPSASKWNSCSFCLELTGTPEYLRGDKKLASYHMKAKCVAGRSLFSDYPH